MNWTEKQSIKLSKGCIYLFALLIVGIIIFMPKFIEAIVPVQAVAPANRLWFIGTLDSCLVVGLGVLFFLNRLLNNLNNDQTFSEENIKLLRVISWLCFLETLILLISTSYYYPWLFVAGVAAVVGLIVRVIKNVFCQALLIKKENDFTI